MVRAPEAKAAEKFATMIDGRSFNVGLFAYTMASEGPEASLQAYRVFMAMCQQWAMWLDEGVLREQDKELLNLACYAKRILEVAPIR